MRELFWKILGLIASRPLIADYLIARSQLTPYKHLPGYMRRYWLFNSYSGDKYQKASFWPSVRIHHILRPDLDQHLHDHPWDCRTIILKGWYIEHRLSSVPWEKEAVEVFSRHPGNTASIKWGEFHQIAKVSDGGVWTLFFTWEFQGIWGFLVNGKKIPYWKYLAGKRE